MFWREDGIRRRQGTSYPIPIAYKINEIQTKILPLKLEKANE